MHFCCHIDENWFVRNCPFVNTIRRHHGAHHDQSIMMETNMNLTFPIADWMFGTSDLDRGLLGHLFNGYDERYVKKDLRRASRTPRVQAAQLQAPKIQLTSSRKAPEGSSCRSDSHRTVRSLSKGRLYRTDPSCEPNRCCRLATTARSLRKRPRRPA